MLIIADPSGVGLLLGGLRLWLLGQVKFAHNNMQSAVRPISPYVDCRIPKGFGLARVITWQILRAFILSLLLSRRESYKR